MISSNKPMLLWVPTPKKKLKNVEAILKGWRWGGQGLESLLLKDQK